jgi:hypothetical protein
MGDLNKALGVGNARIKKREQIVQTALALVGAEAQPSFDPVHSPLCAIDIVMVAGAPWLKDALERDYSKDESGYKKIGGGANTPKMAYFFRSAANLMHFLKRQGLYIPRGGQPEPAAGMACFLDWDDRGRFNFAPDRSAIITECKDGHIDQIAIPQAKNTPEGNYYYINLVTITTQSTLDLAIIGYSDLP